MTATPDYEQSSQAWRPPQQQPMDLQQPTMYDPHQLPPGETKHSQPGTVRLVLEVSNRTVVGLGALAVAVAACVAPFLRFWLEKYSSTQPGPLNTRLVISGFGHYKYHPVAAAADQIRGHDTNYGVALVVAAILLGVAATMLIAHKGNAVISLLLAVIGGSMLTAIAVEIVMDRSARFSFDDKYTRWSVGYGWWLTVLAGALGAVMAITGTAMVVKSTRVPSSIEAQPEALTA